MWWKRMSPGTAQPAVAGQAAGLPRWWVLLASRPDVWHWVLYVFLALLALLFITGPLRD